MVMSVSIDDLNKLDESRGVKSEFRKYISVSTKG